MLRVFMNNGTGEGKFARYYDLTFNPFLGQVHQSIAKLCGEYHIQKIIDLGSGTGEQARILAQHGFTVTGIDASVEMIDLAKRKSSDQINFIHKDIKSLDLKDGIFDAANICLVLHPNSMETIQNIVHKAKTLVRREGVVFITDYGRGWGVKGYIAHGLIQIIESLANQHHRTNYFSFMRHGAIDMFSSWNDIKILDKKSYFKGALQTFVIQFI